MEPRRTEKDFNLKLRPYQEEDVKFLSKLYSGACFNEQRTGKTPTALRTMARKGCSKILIICPPSCVLPWAAEYSRWLERPCIACIGTREKQYKLIKEWTHGLVVSYNAMQASKRTNGLVDLLLKQKPDAIIIDEAHKIKNPKACVTKSVFKLSKIQHKLALTATPAPNKPYEIWSILHFLFPAAFRSYWNFLEEFFNIETNYTAGHTFKEIGSFKPGATKKLQQILASFTVQRKRKDVFSWLTTKDYMPIFLTPTEEQKSYLNSLTQYYEVDNVICQGTLDRLTRYRQICTAPEILNLKGPSAKLLWLKDYLNDYPERKVIIFTKFKQAIPFIQNCVPNKHKAAVITGDLNLNKREDIRSKFQSGDYTILIAQIDTCKEGLTLDNAETIVFVDKYPPISDILQAEDRFIATTKEKSNKAHTIIELILKNTYDEELYKLIAKNASEVDVVNNFKKYLK